MKSLEGTGEGSEGRRTPPGSPLAGDATVEDTGWYGFLEDMLARSAEEAQGYRIMHEKAYKHYHKISTRLTIPAIILSTLTGVANFGQSSLEPYLGSNAPLFIGAVSIVAAVFSTIAKYLRADEKSELNRSAMIQWDKLHRMLVTVLSQPRGKRVEAQEFLLQYREERNRLSEQMPVIPYKIRGWFMQNYGQQYSTTIQRPGILSIADVPVYRADTPGDGEPPAAHPSARDGPASRYSPLPRPAGTIPGPAAAAATSYRGPSPRPIGSRMAAVSSHFLPARPSPPPGSPAAGGGARLAQVVEMARRRREALVAESAISETATRAAETAATAAAVAVGNAATRAVTDALGKITRDYNAAPPPRGPSGAVPAFAASALAGKPPFTAPLQAPPPSAFLTSHEDPNRRDSSSSGSIAGETATLAVMRDGIGPAGEAQDMAEERDQDEGEDEGEE